MNSMKLLVSNEKGAGDWVDKVASAQTTWVHPLPALGDTWQAFPTTSALFPIEQTLASNFATSHQLPADRHLSFLFRNLSPKKRSLGKHTFLSKILLSMFNEKYFWYLQLRHLPLLMSSYLTLLSNLGK